MDVDHQCVARLVQASQQRVKTAILAYDKVERGVETKKIGAHATLARVYRFETEIQYADA